MPQDGVRTFNENVWHYCHRCERKTDLNTELQWQYGMLLCEDCLDEFPVLQGAIEAQQARVLETIVHSPDMRPHEKLVQPTEQITGDDIFV
jgi:ribulose bisphosphate carboxylase small subunit